MFREAFRAHGPPAHFSYEGLNALYDWFEQFEKDIESELEINVDAICYEFKEYESLEAFNLARNKKYATMEQLNEDTIMIPIDESRFIIQSF